MQSSTVRYVLVRWLSLEQCVNLELKKYVSLKSYFQSEEFNSETRFQRLNTAFSNPLVEVYLLFYQYALPIFTNFNKFLQREEPLIHILKGQIQIFLSKLCSKFIKPAYKIKHFEEDLECSVENQKDDNDLSIGLVTKTTLRKLCSDGDVTQQQIDKFYDAVRAYYLEAFNYCVQWKNNEKQQ